MNKPFLVGEEENTDYLTPNNDYENVTQVIKLMKIASYLTQNRQKTQKARQKQQQKLVFQKN